VQNALDLSVPASGVLVESRKTAWIQLAGHAGTLPTDLHIFVIVCGFIGLQSKQSRTTAVVLVELITVHQIN